MHLKLKIKMSWTYFICQTKYNISKLHVFTKRMVYLKAPILIFLIWTLFSYTCIYFYELRHLPTPTFIHNNLT
jgi:hypothetical protein